MSAEQHPSRQPPEGGETERLQDLVWVRENAPIFIDAATTAFAAQGKGAIVVDTTSQPIEGSGNPFGYFPQEMLEVIEDKDIQRMVDQYDPATEFVVVLLKSGGTSTYRVQFKAKK